MKTFLISLLTLCCVRALAAEQPPIPTAHTTRSIEGWTVRVDDRLLQGDGAARGARALQLLGARLVAITIVVPEKALAKLRAIPIELDLDYAGLHAMQYHPDAGWLKDHGYNENLAKCVHIPVVEDFLSPFENHRMPWVVLHELAHGYHDQVLGFDEPRVKAAWKKFRDSGKYQSVLTSPGGNREHYGITNPQEFFAEMTECYFGSNDFYPFVTGELKQAEPGIFDLLAEVWGPLPERGPHQTRDAAKTPPAAAAKAARPNIILTMTDDQGWGDTSYNGLKKIQTPTLDAMAAGGVRFDRFYAAHPSCSPTRASVMTGRHPYRMGCFWPGMPLRTQEMTIAQAVKLAGYSTAHFGKWHLSGGAPGKGRPLPASDPLHPGHFGFDYWFTVSNWFDTDWTFSRNGAPVKTTGDGSDAIVAEALTFIEKNAKEDKPFLAVVWFGSPHVPLAPTPEDLKAAGGSPYYGEMVGVDRSMGTLRAGLRKLGIAENTLVWFNSDNGAWMEDKAEPDAFGSNTVLRGHKGELWEGGIRVPGLIEWPARIKKPFATSIPVCTSDIYPTVMEILKLDVPGKPQPLDGISLVPLLDGEMKQRPKPIGFWHHGEQELEEGPVAWNDNQYKLHKRGPDKYELYDLIADLSEKNDLAAKLPEVVNRMKAEMEAWQASVRRSIKGEDYPEKMVIEPVKPVGK